MKKDEKAAVVAELNEKFSRARVAILTECTGLPVNQVTELRKQLRAAKANTGSLRIESLRVPSKGPHWSA